MAAPRPFVLEEDEELEGDRLTSDEICSLSSAIPRPRDPTEAAEGEAAEGEAAEGEAAEGEAAEGEATEGEATEGEAEPLRKAEATFSKAWRTR